MGSRSYPIWVDITSCIYQGKKSYGVKRHGIQHIYVGTSAQNSHYFATVELNCIPSHDKKKQFTFQIIVDNILMKEARLDDKELTVTKKK